MITGIIVLLLAIAGSAYAYYSASATGEIVGTAAGGGLELTVTKLSTSANGALIPLDNDVDTLSTAAKGYGNSTNNFDDSKSCIDKNGYSVCQIYKITISNTSTVAITVTGGVTLSKFTTPNLACAIMDTSTSVSNNNTCKFLNSLADDYLLAAQSNRDYYVIVYIENLDAAQIDAGPFNGKVIFTTEKGKVEANFGDVENAADYISNLYNSAPKTNVENGRSESPGATLTYNLAPSVNLMNDRLGGITDDLDGGNIRYYGANPNNYVYFNCETYPDTNCELWRIIGVFDDKIKIIRAEPIGEYSWDTSASDIHNGWGVDQWGESGDYKGADLMKLLNPGYENNEDLDSEGNTITVNNSLYWNSESGVCYNGESNATTTCDFTNIGLKNNITRNIIATVTWGTGMSKFKDMYASDHYERERSNLDDWDANSRDGIIRTQLWDGKIAPMYISDYGYATDFATCNTNMRLYNSSNNSYSCRSKNWIYSLDAFHKGASTLTRIRFIEQSSIAIIAGSGRKYEVLTDYPYVIIPTLFLIENINIISGTGTENDPYRLG